MSLALCVISLNANATESLTYTIRPPRPKVGLVLGGGGAKGAAHIGVLKYIEEIGLPIDYIAGTSMGSIIGGLYALGYTPDEIEYLISHLDWSQYMSNTVQRSDISAAEKQRRSTYLVSIPFNHGMLIDQLREMNTEDKENDGISFISSLPDSFIGGADLLNLFNSLCIGYQEPMDFNDFPIPFACVATNLTTGEPVVLRSGKFPEAIRASMAIPGVFSPITIDGQILVDGGLVNNFPVDVCREMGADIVIGIEVASGMVKDMKKLRSLPQLVSQLKNIMTKGHNEENRHLCDLYIHPQVNDFGMLSFNAKAIDTIVQRGYQYASKTRDQLLTIKRYVTQAGPAPKILQAPKAQYIMDDTIRIETVNMDNVTPREFRWLFRKSKLNLDKDISSHDIQRAVNIFKGTGSFSTVEYRMSPAGEMFSPKPKKDFNLSFVFQRAEPHSLSIGLNYNSEESAALLWDLGLGQNKLSGLKFNLKGRVGLNTKAGATLTWAGISLANFNLAYNFQRTKYNSILNPNQSNALIFNRNLLRFYISEFHLRNIQTQVGLEAENYVYPRKPSSSDASSDNTSYRLRNSSRGPYVTMSFDNMDHAYFATEGFKTNFEFHERFSKNTASPLTDVALAVKYHISTGRFTFIPQLYTRHLFGRQVQYAYSNIVGGDVISRYYDYQLPFIGINNTTLTQEQTSIVRIDCRYRLFQKQYLSAIFNYLRSAPNIRDHVTFNGGLNHWGCALKYSYDSPIGPISFDIHYSDITNDWGSYFSLGFIF